MILASKIKSYATGIEEAVLKVSLGARLQTTVSIRLFPGSGTFIPLLADCIITYHCHQPSTLLLSVSLIGNSDVN